MNKSIIILALALILIITHVSAIGITPGSTKINFEPNKEQEVNFKILNNEKKDMKVFLNIEGDLAQYVTLSNILVDFKAIEESKSFTYKIKMPGELEKPGTHTAKIIALELPPKAESQGNYIGARIGVVSRLEVQVPYPGKYAEAELLISEAEVSKPTLFIVKIYNHGQENIEKARASIDILGPTNELITTIETDEISVKSKDIKEISAKHIFENPGSYNAIARLRYDDKLTRTEKTFSIGKIAIEIKSVEVKNFRLGGIAKFEILVENRWNDLLKNVFTEITMKTKEGSEISKFKSTSIDLPALAQETLLAYWDTENIEQGQYDATIILNYGDGKKTEKQFKADVSIDNIKINLFGGTARVTTSTGSIFQGSLISLLVIVLIIINIAWFIYFKKRIKTK